MMIYVTKGWSAALDEADAWMDCEVTARGGGEYMVQHFDDPHNYYVDEIGNIEAVAE